MSSEPRTDGPVTPAGRRLAERALATLDGLIAAGAAVCLLYLAFGGFDLGFVSVRRFSKPFLLLLVLASLRAAIPRSSWLPRLLGDAARRIRDRAAILDRRTPWAAAAFDALVAVLTVHLLPKGTAFLANVLFPAARPRPFPMPFESAKFAADLRGLGLGLVLRHRPAGLLLEPHGAEQHRVLPAVPDADAGAGLALRGR